MKQREEPLGDPLVRSLYRELAGERAPEDLGDAILAEARAAMEFPRSRGGGLLRPLTWAATVGLCVAVVLQIYLTQTPGRQPAATPGPAADLHETAVEMRARKLGDGHREKSGTAGDPSADDAARRSSTAASPRVASPAGAWPEDADATRRPTDSACAPESRLGRDAWQQCIEALEAAGDVERAAAERERLKQAYSAESTIDD